MASLYPDVIDLLSTEGLVHLTPDTLRLSNEGLMVADSVIENFADPETPRLVSAA